MVDTEIAPEHEQPALAAPTPEPIGGWPDWRRRSLIAVVLIGALAVAVWMVGSSNSGQNSDVDKAVIVSLTPNDGSQALRQTEVGADLAVGYDGRLTINNVEIPEEQMVGARDPSIVAPDDLQANGLRANNRNQVYFKPGPGKVIEKFEPGTVDIVLRYFKEGEGTNGGTVRWSIKVI
ncbi:hypothetical protein ACE2AJ_16380 [Aquihabitans daechungensis]|uniref:hypothetical protein n=1 Tax=Aquihabitans daechungensis TaxID=1052257 RepID=UPI003BA1F03F